MIPTHGRLPVPWVARWTREAPDPEDPLPGAGFMKGIDGQGNEVYILTFDGAERDEDGWLWVPAPDDRSGKPEFAQVHPERHRRCMDELLCQVCGDSCGEPSTWLVAPWDLPSNGRSPIDTTHAPVCVSCVDKAMEFCPHLRDTPGWAFVTAQRVERLGVVGDVYDLSGQIVYQGVLRLNDKRGSMALARQRIVRLHDWTKGPL